MAKSLEYWFTCGSTYNYLTVHRIEALAEAAGVTLILKPFYLGQIFRETGVWPFQEGSDKTDYMWHDIRRSAVEMGLSPKLPAPYPCPDTDLANRVAQVTIERGLGLAWVKASYVAWYDDGLMAGSMDNLAQSLPRVGLDLDETLASANKIEPRLAANTDEARAKRIFGAPTCVVGTELFWGNDRLEHALAAA